MYYLLLFAVLFNLIINGYSRTLTEYTISEMKCQEYIAEMLYREKEFWNAGLMFQRKLLLIKGRNADAREFPHMGAVGWWHESTHTFKFLCASVLISPNFVLTAAHCSTIANPEFKNFKKPSIVRLGACDITDSRQTLDVVISEIIIYPDYASPHHYYDIALFKFTTSIKFNEFVHPACLKSIEDFYTSEEFSVTGWGTLKERRLESSPRLQAAAVNVIDPITCDMLLRFYHNRKWKGLRRHQLCAGNLDGGADSCQGDSGGPLQYKELSTRSDGNLYSVVGITSFGFHCGRKNLPGVYTRVSDFIDWIEYHVWLQ